mgnify:CR=1 FL=1|jgi:predicted RNA-binding Zn-ribbon protein involved in translation (DUF1610 family)
MALRFPNDMNECVYFTNRVLEGGGKAIAWVFKEKCPECKKGIMGKPRDEKTGKAKIRALEYVCDACGHTVEKVEYEDTLTCNIQYTCSECKFEGEVAVPYKRKSYKGAKSVLFECEKCKAQMAVTKKMKALKEKKK